MQLMAEPARLHVKDFYDSFHVLGTMADLRNQARLNAVQHTGQDRFGRLPDDAEDRNGYQKPDNWVG